MKSNYKFLLLLFFFYSTVSFSQWNNVTNDLPSSWPISLSIDALNENQSVLSLRTDYFSAPRTSIFTTTNNGANWQRFEWSGIHEFEEASDVSIISSLNFWVATSKGRILQTSDGGNNWNEQFNDTSKTEFLNYIEMFDDMHGIAMGDAKTDIGPAVFLKTTNGGVNWISVNDSAFGGYSGDTWRRLDFINIDEGCFYESGVNPQKLYKTTDGCSTWSEVNFPSGYGVHTLKMYDSNICLVYAYKFVSGSYLYYVLRTTDGGNNWDVIPFTPAGSSWGNDIEFCPNDPNKVWFTDGGAVYYSSDMGSNWTLQIDLSAENTKSGRDIVMTDENHGWLLTDKAVYRTSNGGTPVVSVESEEEIPTEFALYQNYPNPFNPATTINYQIPQDGAVKLVIYDALGREVRTLVNEFKTIGRYKAVFNANELASGVYIYHLKVNDFVQTRKMMLLK